jgi:superfamily I DNA/RNA helicase
VNVDENAKAELALSTTSAERRKVLNKTRDGVLPKVRRQLSDLRANEIKQLGASYPRILASFYQSDHVRRIVNNRIGSQPLNQFDLSIRDQVANRFLSTVDRYYLLWIIYYLTRRDGVETDASDVKNVKPLPTYSHVMIDEAQYYHPLLLRLFASLARSPFNSMTIVGDLEQKMTTKGGLVSWEEMRLNVSPDRIRRLETNYRWSKQVYAFLTLYKTVAGLSVILKEPYGWPSGEGVRPDIVSFPNRTVEMKWIVDRVGQCKASEQQNRWTIVIVIPEEVVGAEAAQKAVKTMIADWKSCDIKARWATGEDIKESTEQVILTNYDSIVGLEFDAVIVMATDHMLANSPERDAVQSFWVAITRARQYIAVTYLRDIPQLQLPEFAPYRSYPSSD